MSVNELSSYLESNDARGFLRHYMTLVAEGANLQVPTSLETKGAQDGWSQILGSLGNCPDQFLNDLTTLWLSLVKKQGGRITENFADQIVALLDGKAKPADVTSEDSSSSAGSAAAGAQDPQQSAQSDAESSGDGDSEEKAPASTRPLDTVESNISTDYREYQSVFESTLLPKDELEKRIQGAIRRGDEDGFLINYLNYSRHGDTPAVPKSSVVNIIKSQWEEILLDQFYHMPNSEFLNAVSNRWFFLVNHEGFPSTPEAMDKILVALTTGRKGDHKKHDDASASHEIQSAWNQLKTRVSLLIKRVFKK